MRRTETLLALVMLVTSGCTAPEEVDGADVATLAKVGAPLYTGEGNEVIATNWDLGWLLRASAQGPALTMTVESPWGPQANLDASLTAAVGYQRFALADFSASTNVSISLLTRQGSSAPVVCVVHDSADHLGSCVLGTGQLPPKHAAILGATNDLDAQWWKQPNTLVVTTAANWDARASGKPVDEDTVFGIEVGYMFFDHGT